MNRIVPFLSFILSLSLHAAILTGIGFVANIKISMGIKDFFKNEKKPIFSIESIDAKDLPEINRIGKESKINKKENQNIKNLTKKEEIGKEEIIKNVDSNNKNLEETLKYEDIIKLKIQKVKRYPEIAKRQGIEGDVYLSFEILKDGNIGVVDILNSSGNSILDEEAIKTIKRAAPYPPVPDYYGIEKLNLKVKIIYTLN